MWLIETKGWEQEDVPLKDARAKGWCEDATKLTGVEWRYLKVPYSPYFRISKSLTSMPSEMFIEFLNLLKKVLADDQVELKL